MSTKNLAMIVMVSLLVMGSALEAEAQESQGGEQVQQSECDRFVEAYVRSSARKIHRALSRDEYQLQSVDLGESLTLEVEGGESIDFEVFSEHDGRVVAVVDRTREWEQTYLVAQAGFGPIVVSQTWQARHLRDAGQACEPIYSTVEWPSLTASTVDMDPFEFWGLRVVWRVPSPQTATPSDRSVTDVLREIVVSYKN